MSNFSSAIEEYKKAVSHLTKMAGQDSSEGSHHAGLQRRFCEAFFKASLASELTGDLSQAAEFCDKAIEAIKLERELSDGSVREELAGIEKDLVERKDVTSLTISQIDQVKAALRQMLEQQLDSVQGEVSQVPAADPEVPECNEDPAGDRVEGTEDHPDGRKRESGFVSESEGGDPNKKPKVDEARD